LKLSFIDRNAINEEIHGVRSLAVNETPQIIANALYAFRIELEILPPTQKKAYLFIRQQQRQQQQQQQQHHANPVYNGIPNATMPTETYAAYIDDDDFQLRFLRCCLFNISRAVGRFTRYLNFVQTHWGDSCLARPIQLSDLNASETKQLKKGWWQLLPFRDRRGRRIVALVGDGSDIGDLANIKTIFYIIDCATRDSVESQRNGIVIILDGNRSTGVSSKTTKLLDIMRSSDTHSINISAHWSMPSRIVGFHVCWPHSPILRTISKLFLFQSAALAMRHGNSGSSSAVEPNRIMFHSGDETEMRYKVKSYGIPIELLPLTGTNSIKLNYHNQWIRTRRLVETYQNYYGYNCEYKCEYECGFETNKSNREPVTIVECPCSNDVVFRNGTHSMDNPGNTMFRNLILSYWENNNKFRLRSTDFRDNIVRDIEVHKKGRFLDWNKDLGVWVVIKDKTRIQRKVAMVLYNFTKRRYNSKIDSGRADYHNKSASLATPSMEQRRREKTSNSSSHHEFTFAHADETMRSSNSVAYQFIDKSNNISCRWP